MAQSIWFQAVPSQPQPQPQPPPGTARLKCTVQGTFHLRGAVSFGHVGLKAGEKEIGAKSAPAQPTGEDYGDVTDPIVGSASGPATFQARYRVTMPPSSVPEQCCSTGNPAKAGFEGMRVVVSVATVNCASGKVAVEGTIELQAEVGTCGSATSNSGGWSVTDQVTGQMVAFGPGTGTTGDRFTPGVCLHSSMKPVSIPMPKREEQVGANSERDIYIIDWISPTLNNFRGGVIAGSEGHLAIYVPVTGTATCV